MNWFFFAVQSRSFCHLFELLYSCGAFLAVIGTPTVFFPNCIEAAFIIQKPVPVEGDVVLLNQLAGLQRAYSDQLIAGTWEADIRQKDAKAKVKIEWSGDSKRVDYAVQPWDGDTDGSRGIAIRHLSRQSTFDEDLLSYLHADGLGRSFSDPLEITPINTWYYLHGQVLWSEMLDEKEPRGNVVKFLVSDRGDRVIVDRIYEGGSILRIEFSKSSGNNIVRYETLFPDDSTVLLREGQISWDKNDSGYFPSELKAWAYSPQNSRPAEPDIEFKTLGFELKAIDTARFGIPRNKFRVGTLITNFTADGQRLSREVVGGKKGELQRTLLLQAFEVRKSLGLRHTEAKESP